MARQVFVLHKGAPDRTIIRDRIIELIQKLPESRSFAVEVKQYVKERTLDQTAALFGVAYKVIMDATGLRGEKEREKLHTDLCGDYFGWVDRPIIGRVPVRTTTTDERGERNVLSTVEMAKFYDYIQDKMLEYGIMIPNPDPAWKRDEALAESMAR